MSATSVYGAPLMMRLDAVSQKSMLPPVKNTGASPALLAIVTAPVPVTWTGARKLTLCCAFKVSRWLLVHENVSVTAIESAPDPVVTVTSPSASIAARSLTFSTAFFDVDAQTPDAHFICRVLAVDRMTAACAAEADATRAAVSATRRDAVLVMFVLLR